MTTADNPFIQKNKKIRAVLWDVYGTLLAAQRGDLDALVRREPELRAAFAQTIHHFQLPATPETLCRQFLSAIAARRNTGNAHTEIRIEEIWRHIAPTAPPRDIAMFFERAVNPKQPMPGALETLRAFQHRGYRQGILSNAQFYTRIELDECFGPGIFDPALIFLSCDLGVAKPDLTGFRLAIAELARTGIAAGETLFVGDSLTNDIAPARQVGFQVAHFGADIRQLSDLLERQ
jgi:putative hydrolase of the HAD superfamily